MLRTEGFLRPELLNRIDEVVIFHQLRREQLDRIVEIQLGHLRKRLAERGMELKLTDAAKHALGEEGFDPVFGARPLKRVIQQRVENALASRILNGEFGAGDSVVVDYRGKSFTFEKEKAGRGNAAAR
jgi:ATP-dependent Clp protease ATP-binding subunit ClpB